MIACFRIRVSDGYRVAFGLYLRYSRTGSGPVQEVEFQIAAAQGQTLSRSNWPNPAAREICGVTEI